MTDEELRRARKQLVNQPPNASHSERFRALLREAEAAEHTAVAILLRTDVLVAEQARCAALPPEERAPVVERMRLDFAPLMRVFRDRPELFDDAAIGFVWDAVGFFLGDLTHRAAAPVDALHAFLDELEPQVRAGTADVARLVTERFWLADAAGEHATALRLFHRMRTMDRLDETTERDYVEAHIDVLVELGRYAEAVRAAEPLLAGHITTTDPSGSPEDLRPVHLRLLIPYLRTGRLEEARAAYRRAADLVQMDPWRRNDNNWLSVEPEQARYAATRLEFLALSGNEVRALDLLRQAPPVLGPVHDHGRLRVTAATALVCHRLVRTGRGRRTLTALDPDGSARTATVERLHAGLADQALRFARQADACFGTTYWSDRTRALIDAEPVTGRLDLELEH